jgi:hypothetical protein
MSVITLQSQRPRLAAPIGDPKRLLSCSIELASPDSPFAMQKSNLASSCCKQAFTRFDAGTQGFERNRDPGVIAR